MAKQVNISTSLKSLDIALERFGDEAKTSLARTMGAAGGRVLRDEAKRNVPVKTGKLRDSIYLAYMDKESSRTVSKYRVSWNSAKAPHGHLIEFGHWLVKGGKLTDGGVRIKFVEAKPFLGPALSKLPEAFSAMIAAGKARAEEIAKEISNGP